MMKQFVGMCCAILFFAASVSPFSIDIQKDAVKEPEKPVIEVEEKLEELQKKEQIEVPIDIYEPVVTMHKSEESDKFIWDELSRYSPSDEITAGIMGYFYKESFMRSNAVAGWPDRNRGSDADICVAFTEEVDAGLHDGSSKDYFIEMVRIHYGGYGLGQWSAEYYLEHFYEFVREREGSIGDAAIQCEFIFESLQRNEKLWNDLKECDTAFKAGRRIGVMYDGTCLETAHIIADMAEKFYKEYS